MNNLINLSLAIFLVFVTSSSGSGQDVEIEWGTIPSVQLSKLEKDIEELAKVPSRVEKLEGWAEKQNMMKTAMNLTQRANYMSAFSAGYDDETDLLATNEVLVFRKVHMKIGDGYDETKGIFTAPVDGYYVFHLTVFYYDKYKSVTNYIVIKVWTTHHGDLGVNIVANGKAVAQAYVDDPKDNIQASVSTVVKLRAGQEVKPVVSHLLGKTNTLNLGITRSGFTGYLIKQF